MLSKNKIKFINSIKKKKYRDIHRCFFVEGEKLVDELIQSNIKPISIFATSNWIELNKSQLNDFSELELVEVSEEELKKISALATPNKALAIVPQYAHSFLLNEIQKQLSLFLDEINDPGNLGTIIRIADWFGIQNVFCTENSVDVYNPKVAQSSMGAIFRVKVHYVDSISFLNQVRKYNDYPIYGTFLEGNNIYDEKLSKNGLIILGSESHGISEKLKPFINQKLFIPNYPAKQKTSESLNISTATSIVCSEFRRRII